MSRRVTVPPEVPVCGVVTPPPAPRTPVPVPVPVRPAVGAHDRGSGTVLLVGVVAVGMLLLGATGLLVGAERARATAQAAADLAALAGAAHLAAPVGSGGDAGTACALAAGVARRNGARLTSCSTTADGVITVGASRPAAGVGTARAAARAGPAAARDTS